MGDERLVHMANQIARFFEAYPRDKAVPAIAEHIELFWDKRMRDKFTALLAEGGEDLTPLAREAGLRLKDAAARTR